MLAGWTLKQLLQQKDFDVWLCVHCLTLHVEGKITAARSSVSSVKQPEDWGEITARLDCQHNHVNVVKQSNSVCITFINVILPLLFIYFLETLWSFFVLMLFLFYIDCASVRWG